MLIYKDIITGDEVISDNFEFETVREVLWTTNIRKYIKKIASSIEGQAEEGDEDNSGNYQMVYDIEDQYRLVWLKSEEGYIRALWKKLKETGASQETLLDYQSNAFAGMKKILANYDDCDVSMTSSMDPMGMYVVIDYREDNITPYAILWKHGLEEVKV